MSRGIVWLASYPKSGNTWVRVFVDAYQSQVDGPPDPNRLSVYVASQTALFDRFGAVEASELADDEVQSLRPDLYRSITAASRCTVFFKVHDAFGSTPEGTPLFPGDATRAVIYIIRHPCDVAVSWAFHYGTSMQDAVAILCREDWVIGDGANQCRQRLRSWGAHVRSWIDDSRLPVCVVRYEDLLVDPVRQFRRIIEAAGLPVDDRQLSKAVRHSSFERLQAIERDVGFVERLPGARAPFFRAGISGGWRQHLSDQDARRLIDAHADIMRRFQYLPAEGGLLSTS